MSGIDGLKFRQSLNFEFNQNIRFVDIRYAHNKIKINNCKLKYKNVYLKNSARRPYIRTSRKRKYELAHANAVKSLGNLEM